MSSERKELIKRLERWADNVHVRGGVMGLISTACIQDDLRRAAALLQEDTGEGVTNTTVHHANALRI